MSGEYLTLLINLTCAACPCVLFIRTWVKGFLILMHGLASLVLLTLEIWLICPCICYLHKWMDHFRLKRMKQLKDCIYLQTTHSTHGLEQTWEEYQSAVTLDDPSTRVTVSGATEANTSRVKSWMRRTPLQCQHFIL